MVEENELVKIFSMIDKREHAAETKGYDEGLARGTEIGKEKTAKACIQFLEENKYCTINNDKINELLKFLFCPFQEPKAEE